MGLILEARGPFYFHFHHTACLLGLLDSSDPIMGVEDSRRQELLGRTSQAALHVYMMIYLL